MDERDLRTFTYRHLPPQVVRDLMRAVFMAHRDAWEHCRQEFERPEAANVIPFYRRGKLEQSIRHTAERHAAISAEVIKQPGQPWNHTELTAGPLILTAATVQKNCGRVEPSEYRRNLAFENPTLFDSVMDTARKKPIPQYLLLLHCRSEWPTPEEYRDFGHLPGSIYLAYPSADLDSYHASINLFFEFPDVVRNSTPQEWDEQELVRYMERSRRVA